MTAFSLDPVPARRGKPPQHLADLTPEQRREAVVALGLPGFRADQLSRQYFTRYNADVATMTDLPVSAREAVSSALFPPLLQPVRDMVADGGATVKSLWQLVDGSRVESVLMRYGSSVGSEVPGAVSAELGAESDAADEHPVSRVTVCVSSQAGCGMACPFCATGQLGLTRNLSTAEIVDQVVAASRAVPDDQGPGRVSNVVFMGMGEPMANYAAVVGALHRLIDSAPAGIGMSPRRITVSTVGLVPRIKQLSGEGMPVTLAVSLHAPDDEARDELVPVNTRWKVAELLDAAREYFEVTGRRVSIEYALIRDVNDQGWRAEMLGRLLNERGRGWVHVNPIPLNPTPGSRWTASRAGVERAFVNALRAAGVPTTVRDTRGRDIDGACGQLAAAEA
ncbi:MAG: 23S rRNA (adenine(2503)-C(2))-methyltransferase RlmN [Jiangellales bacterium]